MRTYLRVANVYEDRIDLRNVMSMNFAHPKSSRPIAFRRPTFF